MLVSILIPCFNAKAFIAECIESALAQTWPHKEVIVVDDGSTDGSLEVIRKFDRSIVWETGPNRGGNAARNRLLDLAKGEWLQYLDADDYLRPGKVAGQAEFASTQADVDVICSPIIAEKKIGEQFVWYDSQFSQPRDPWVMLALWHLPQTGGALWKRAALERVRAWRVEQPCCQEHELYFRLLEAGARISFVDECLAVHRIWHDGRVTQRENVDIERLRIIDRMEDCLRHASQLTAMRLQAINDARHHIGRKLWHRDRAAALEVVRRIKRSDSSFCPTESPFSPAAYRLVYKALGFLGAQHVADSKRKLDSMIGG